MSQVALDFEAPKTRPPRRYVAVSIVFAETHPCGAFPLAQRALVDSGEADAYVAQVRQWCAEGTWPELASITVGEAVDE